jgi:hypothetical protein
VPAPAGLLVLASALATGTPGVRAAEWSWTPTYTFWVDHDSNRYLVPDGTPSEGTAMSLDLQLQYATERFTLALHPQASLQRFDEPEYPGVNDVSLGGVANYATGRSTVGLSTLLSDSSLLTTELPVTGIVVPGTRRREEDESVSWTYAQSETRALTLQVGSVDAAFQTDLPSSETLFDYRGQTLSGTEQWQRSEILALYGTVSAASYSQDGLPGASRTEGVVLGFKRQLSERMTFSADAGVSRTSFLSLSSDGLLADLSLSRSSETGSLSLTASRNVAPIGVGEITQQDTLRFAVQHSLSERLSANASVGLNRYSSVFSIPGLISINLPYLDRTYSQASVGLGWQETETWSLGLQATTSRLQGESVASAEGWQVQFHATWSPRAHSVSR